MGQAEVVEAFESQPTEQEIIAGHKSNAEDIIEGYRDFEIQDDADYEVVAEGLKEIKRIGKQIEEGRKKVTAPLNTALKEFRAWYKPALDICNNTERLLKRKLGDYVVLQEEKSRQAMETAAQASRDGDFDTAHEAAKQIVERPAAKGITVTHYYDYEIVDGAKVPREFLVVNHDAVAAHMKAAGKEEPAAVPGLKFVKKNRTIARTS